MVIIRGFALHKTNGEYHFGLPDSFANLSNERFLGLQYIVWLMVVTFVVLLVFQSRPPLVCASSRSGREPRGRAAGGAAREASPFRRLLISGVWHGPRRNPLTAEVRPASQMVDLIELYAVAAIVMGGTEPLRWPWIDCANSRRRLLIVVLQNGLDPKGVGFDYQQIIIGCRLLRGQPERFLVRRRLAGVGVPGSLALDIGHPPRSRAVRFLRCRRARGVNDRRRRERCAPFSPRL